MPQVKIHAWLIAIVMVLFISISGCSDSSVTTAFNPDSGHPTGWVPSGHSAPAQADLNSCTDCHGSDLGGGIANVACSDCHLGVSSSEVTVHPLTWTSAIDDHGVFVVSNGPTSCGISVCHGVDFKGGSTGDSCDQCHLTYPHSAGWKTPEQHGSSARTNILDCKICHATPGNPPSYDVKYAEDDCLTCHNTSVSGAPHPALWIVGGNFTHLLRIGDSTGCIECHGDLSQDPSCNISQVCHAGG